MLKLMKPDLLGRLMNGNTIWNAEVNNNPQSKVGPGKYDLSNCPYQCYFPLLFTLATTLECIAFSFCLKKYQRAMYQSWLAHIWVWTVTNSFVSLLHFCYFFPQFLCHQFPFQVASRLCLQWADCTQQLYICTGESSLLVEARLFPDIQRAGGKEASACNSLYTDVVLFFFSFFSKTSTSARKKNKERLFSFSLTPIPTR